MFKKLGGVRLVRFEPECHISKLYEWYYSGEYPEFFRDFPDVANASELIQYAINKVFIIIKEDDNSIIGMQLCYQENIYARNFWLGELLEKQFSHKGFGISALKSFLNWKFNYCNFYKMKMHIMAKNKRVCQIMENFGAYREGGETAVFKKDSFLNGEFHDIAVYAMFKTDFNKKYKHEFEHDEPRLESPILEVLHGQKRGRSRAIEAVSGA